MAFNLFDLAATISVQTQDFDRKIKSAGSTVQKLEGDLKKLDRQSATSSAGLSKLGAQGNAAEAGVSSLGKALPYATGGAVLFASALGGAAVGLYKLITASAEATGKFIDLNQQTGFAVETLSALENAAETSGGSIQTVVGALGIFEKNMEAAHEQGSEMARVFKVLNVDINDNEKALRQAFSVLVKMPEGAQQTATAMKLFGRSGKDVLGIIKEIDGDLDGFTKKLRDMGLLISTDTAKRGDQLSDSLVRMRQQFDATGREVAEQFAPDVHRALTELSRLLRENKETAKSWGESLAAAMRGIAALANSELGTAVGWVIKLHNALGGLPAVFKILQAFGGPSSNWMSPGAPSVSGPPGSGVLTDKGRRDAQFEALAESAKKTQRFDFSAPSVSRSTAATDAQKAATARMREQLRGLTDDARKAENELEELAREQKRLAEVSLDTSEAIFRQKQAISDLMTGYPAWLREANNFIVAKAREGVALDDSTKQIYRNNEALKEQLRIQAEGLTRARSVNEIIDTSGIRRSTGNETRPRIATVDMQIMREQMEAYREKMRALADDLTNTIDNALRAGFESGIKAGLVTFAQGILDMIRSAALQALQKKLFEVFSGLGSGGGGSWWQKLIGMGVSVGAGALGGAGGGVKGGLMPGTGGKFANGGFMSPNTWNVVGEGGPELIRSGSHGATVVPNHAMGGSIILHYYASPGDKPASRETMAQMLRQLNRAQQKRTLTG